MSTIYDGNGHTIIIPSGNTSTKKYSPIFNNTQIIGHQANTIAKFETYRTNGLKFVEADIMIASDGTGLLAHNDNFTVNGTTYYISQMTYDQIVATGASIDTLNDLFERCKKFNIALYLDIKNGTTSNITSIYNLVRDWGMLSQTVFGTITTAVAGVLGALNDSLIFDYTGGNNSTIDRAIRELPDCSLIFMHYNTHSSTPSETQITAFKYAHEKGLKSYCWTVDDATVANTDLDDGCDFVMSNSVTNSDMT